MFVTCGVLHRCAFRSVMHMACVVMMMCPALHGTMHCIALPVHVAGTVKHAARTAWHCACMSPVQNGSWTCSGGLSRLRVTPSRGPQRTESPLVTALNPIPTRRGRGGGRRRTAGPVTPAGQGEGESRATVSPVAPVGQGAPKDSKHKASAVSERRFMASPRTPKGRGPPLIAGAGRQICIHICLTSAWHL